MWPRRLQGITLPEGAGQLRDGGDGGEAARRGRGDVVAGGRGRSGARFKRRSNRLYWDYAKNEGLIRLGTSQDSSGPLFSLNHKYDRGRAKTSIGKVAANSRKSSDDIPLYA